MVPRCLEESGWLAQIVDKSHNSDIITLIDESAKAIIL